MCEICNKSNHDYRCPNAKENIEIIGTCQICGIQLTDEYEYIEDDNGNRFCSDDCFKQFYGYRKVG